MSNRYESKPRFSVKENRYFRAIWDNEKRKWYSSTLYDPEKPKQLRNLSWQINKLNK